MVVSPSEVKTWHDIEKGGNHGLAFLISRLKSGNARSRKGKSGKKQGMVEREWTKMMLGRRGVGVGVVREVWVE